VSWDFARELARHGPESPPLAAGRLSEARAYCQYVARSHYENFTVVSRLLPRKLRPHFEAVYAWCRWADDLGDETDPEQSLQLLAWWRRELDACYAGAASHPVTVALAETVRHFAIPRLPFRKLIAAFEQDQAKKDFFTFNQLLGYCRLSANPVGRIVLHLFEAVSEKSVPLSDSICTGLQLANFWQDVARDHAMGRIYVPREDREKFGYGDDDFRAHAVNEPFRDLMRFELKRTRDFFERGRGLLPLLPRRAKFSVALFLGGGEAILDAIEAQDCDVWSRRPVVTKAKKARLMLGALPLLISG
jgi:squalene synthase HpnC